MSAQRTDRPALAPLVPGLQRAVTPERLCLLHGHSSVYALALALGGATRRPFAVIDGAMRFNSYTLARIAASLRLPPHSVLRQAHVTRSFTAFQTESAITTKLARFAAAGRCGSVLVLGLLDTYYDEQITPQECERSLHRVMGALRRIAAAALPVLIADVAPDTPPAGKHTLFPLVRGLSDRSIRLLPQHDGFHLYDERNDHPWDATTIPSHSSSTTRRIPGKNSGAACA